MCLDPRTNALKMDAVYKAILDKQHQRVTSEVKWTADFSKALVKYGVISKDTLRDIEASSVPI